MRKIYIAGGSSEMAECRRVIEAVSAAGWTVTCDWTRDHGWALDRPLTIAERAETASRDLCAIAEASVFWIMLPERPSEGSAAELGAAIMLRTTRKIHGAGPLEIVCSGPMPPSRLFPALADRSFDEHKEALEYILAKEA